MPQDQTIMQIFLFAPLLIATMITILLEGRLMSKSAAGLIPLKQKQELLIVQNDAEIKELVKQVHHGVNQYRASLNLPALTLNANISQQAKIHSQNMAQQIVKFSHQGFETRINALDGQIPYRRAAENIAFNQGMTDPIKTVIAGWINSEGHRQNMIGNFNLIGVAKNRQGEYYFTQIFIKEN